MDEKPRDFRLKIINHLGSATYITRKNGDVRYFNGSETPLFLACLVHQDAAELSFALEDAIDAKDALEAVEKVLIRQWKSNLAQMPHAQIFLCPE